MIGVVLAGGRSTRLGQDKVRLRLPGDGRDMLARTADLLAACTDGVVISCRAPNAGEETLALPGIRSIPDAKPGLGPLGGVWSALRELRQPILVLSCDLPFMDVPTLRRLIDARGARPPETLMTTFQQAETGFIEALVAVYEPACLPPAAQPRDPRKAAIARRLYPGRGPALLQHQFPGRTRAGQTHGRGRT